MIRQNHSKFNESSNHSVSDLFDALRDGDSAAINSIWGRFFDQLIAVTHRKFGDFPKRFADEEDVAVSVFASLFRGIQNHRFPKLQSREDLWAILLTLTTQKVVDLMRFQLRKKRNTNSTWSHPSISHTTRPQPDDDSGLFFELIAAGPTPEFLVEIEDELGVLLSKLRDQNLREVAKQRLEGFTNEEIAKSLGISVHSVGRKVKLIRQTWMSEITSVHP